MQLDIDYLQSMSQRKIKNFGWFFLNPCNIYKEMLCCFKECKRLIYVSELSIVTFTQQPLWNNTGALFEQKDKPIYFLKWVLSNICMSKIYLTKKKW